MKRENKAVDNRNFSLVNISRIHRSISSNIVRTPTLESKNEGSNRLFLKCENLQITDSFKVRGALGALHSYRDLHPDIWRIIKKHGVVTCSSGNFAQGVAYATRQLGVSCTVVVPDSIPLAKLMRIHRFNSDIKVIKTGYAEWQHTMTTSSYPGQLGFFLSSESDPYVSLAIATIGAEILEDLPGVDALLVPYGGGNLSYSTASLVRAVGSGIKVYAVEVTTGAPFSASMRAGFPVDVPYERSFIDGIGASFVIPAQFYRVRDLLSGVLTVDPSEVASALSSLLTEDKIMSEGAGAAAVAAARKYSNQYGWGKPCAVVSGGVMDTEVLLDIVSRNLLPSLAA
ncbi:threonine/serine dehydratase [Streptomyces sp. NPDC060085]|uniref:threonine ammonia-lyase n=1 Tax=Streptomyces sp. NPDC060085 TaxID=3347054 RepID=UPI003659F6B8